MTYSDIELHKFYMRKIALEVKVDNLEWRAGMHQLTLR